MAHLRAQPLHHRLREAQAPARAGQVLRRHPQGEYYCLKENILKYKKYFIKNI